jgi:hypothetical protein
MTRPYRSFVSQVTYLEPLEEAVLLVRLRHRRAGISRISGKPRAIYDARPQPFAQHVVRCIADLHRVPPVDTARFGRWNEEIAREERHLAQVP